ncbi:MAG: DUF4097 family beta strand repeat protein [Anaerolineae bacterium]|nr:DUF4097 family beta strand repeat protein [Anaerolineae bacterium]
MNTSTERYEVTSDAQIIVETTSGDVQLHGHDASHVEVRASREAQVEQDAGTLRIRSKPGGSSDLRIAVPHRCKLSVHLASGDVQLRDVGGEIAIRSMSGDVDAWNASGVLHIRTVSGDTTLRAAHLTELSIETVSGDSSVETSLVDGGQYQVRSVSGDLRLGLDEGQACTVAMTSLSGDLACDVAHQVASKERGSKRIVIGDGGPLVQVHTTSGDVRIVPKSGQPTEEEGSPFESEWTEAEPEPVRAEEAGSAPDAEPFGLDDNAEAEAEEGSSAERRMAILKAIEEGKMPVSEGLAKLRALD